ncbi:MAG TPA: hypothetical protein VK973_02860 [Arenicellales bacterium]|nr:hypothetical protein [Arenicellales bacterium]
MATKDKAKRQGLGISAIDVLGVVGLASLTYGCWRVYEPLAYIVFGGLLLAAAVVTARRA